jgi:PAP2 superfamily
MKKLLFAFLILSVFACKQTPKSDFPPVSADWKQRADNANYVHRTVQQVTDVIVYDIFPPMIASRIYSYTTIAGYEALRGGFSDYQSMGAQLKALPAVPKPEAGAEYCFPLASVKAMLVVGKTLTFSEDKMDEFSGKMLAEMKALAMPQAVYERSMAYGEAVGKHILAWAGSDKYKQLRTAPKYTITNDPAKWRPTPPMYGDAIEPSWNKIRTMVMDTCSQFRPVPPTPFSKQKSSKFYKEALEVYKIGTKPDSTIINTAKFWDDNPIATNIQGHFMASLKKISPPGHWLGITRMAAQQTKTAIMPSMQAYMLVSLGLMDGFISCWDEKYRSQLIRPESYINDFIDPNWVPILQTPPFPEYTSGHSVVSGTSATILTHLFGGNVAFTDSTEMYLGLAPRTFPNFKEAAKQASVSRLYGGIHYRPAIEVGLVQGEKLGNYIIGKIHTK